MLKRSLILMIVALPLFAQTGRAQKWDSPMFYSPKPMDELGVYVVSTHDPLFPYNPTGLKAIWRQTGNINLGVQAGVGDLKDVGDALMVGVEFGNTFKTARGSSLIAAWDLAAGASFGHHYVDMSVPLGVSVGLNLGGPNGGFTPFVNPRVSFDLVSVTPTGGTEHNYTSVGLAADLGAELQLGQQLIVRGAYTVGNHDYASPTGKRNAWGVGLALRMPRKVRVVR
jgi:hypothetical protein